MLTKEEKNTLTEIILYSIEDYNCYEKLSIINNNQTQEYLNIVNKISNNHKIETSLYNLLDCRTDSKFNQLCSYIFNKLDEQKIDDTNISARILSKLTDDYTMNSELNRLLIDPNNEENKATAVSFIAEYYIDLDFKRIFINELNKYNSKKLITIMYNNIYTDFSIEEEILENNYNFESLSYMYSKIYFQLFTAKKQLLNEDMINTYYEQSLINNCVNNLNQIIDSQKNKMISEEEALIAYINIMSNLILLQSHPKTIIKGLKNTPKIKEFLKDLEENKNGYKKLSLTR